MKKRQRHVYPTAEIPHGTLHAGCHVIPYSELETMARKLGLEEQ